MTTPMQPLSHREWQVLVLLAQGRSNPEIAQQLVISIHTVEKHLTHIYAKLKVKSRSAACQWVWEHPEHRKNTGIP